MRILVPVDGSRHSNAAVGFVASRSTLLSKSVEVELVHLQYPVPTRVARGVGKEVVAAYHASESDRVLKPAHTRLKRAGAMVTTRTLVGTLADTLATHVAASDADLIVMGTRGHTGLKRLLLGSTTATVAAACTKPLLLLNGGPSPKRDSLRVGIALDGSVYAAAAVRFVAAYRDLLGVSPRIQLIHVAPRLSTIAVPGIVGREVPTGIEPTQVQAMQRAAFESAFGPGHEALSTSGLTAGETPCVGSDAGALIAAWATETKLDLLVLGSIGFGRAEHGVMGSVARRVVERCRTTLLLVREP